MRYVPHQRKYDHNGKPFKLYSLNSSESKWGCIYHRSKYLIYPNCVTCLIPKETYKKLEIITEPIEIMEEFCDMHSDINRSMHVTISKRVKKMVVTGELPKDSEMIPLPEGYKEMLEEVRGEYKKRIDAAGGCMLLQFNVKTGLTGDVWLRFVQPVACEGTGKVRYKEWHKISWFKYLLFSTPRNFIVEYYCKLNNWWYRKEIAEEDKQAKIDADRWLEDMKKIEEQL